MRRSVFSIALFLGVASCSSDLPEPKNASKTKSSASGSDALTSIVNDPARFRAFVASLEANPAALAKFEDRDKTEADELAALKDVNQKLCLRIQQLRRDCAATYRLIAGEAEKELACSAGNGEQNILAAKWEVQMDSSRRHRIVVDNNWESSEFGAGVTAITWKSRSSSTTVSPRLIDLTSIQIVPVDGGSATDLSGFSLLANGARVFAGGDVVKAKESNSYLVVSMQRVLDLRSSASCTVPQAELDTLVKGGG